MPAICRFVRNMTGLDPQEFAVDPDLVRPARLHPLTPASATSSQPPLLPAAVASVAARLPCATGMSAVWLSALRGVVSQLPAMRAGGGPGGGSPGRNLRWAGALAALWFLAAHCPAFA
jgi:hypothetical protein